MFQQKSVEEAVATILRAVGEDLERPGLQDTPQRVARMYQELFSGIEQDPREALNTGFEEEHCEPVILRNIPFYSLCEHHLLPFFGEVHLGYIPNGWVVGVGNLVQALEIVVHRPQLQERLTRQLADALLDAVRPEGVAVLVSAEHLCMTMRGVRKPGTRVLTTAIRGSFQDGNTSKEQLMTLVQGR